MKTATICYSSFRDKRQRYQEQTLPVVLAEAHEPLTATARAFFAQAVGIGAPSNHPVDRLRNLHDTVRAAAYVAERDGSGELVNCDQVRSIHDTIVNGGDCEDWAAVLLRGCKLVGVPAYIVTSGEHHDPFMHVSVAAIVADRLYLLDPKGDQQGAPFNVRSERYPERRYWMQGYGGKAHEVFMGVPLAI